MLYISIQIKDIHFEDPGTAVTWDSHKCLENCQSFLSGSRYRSKNASKNIKLILWNRAWVSLARSQHSGALIWLSSILGTVFLWSLLIKHFLISLLKELQKYNNYYEWSFRVGLYASQIIYKNVICTTIYLEQMVVFLLTHYLWEHQMQSEY